MSLQEFYQCFNFGSVKLVLTEVVVQQLASQINNKVTAHHSIVTACRQILTSPSASYTFVCIEFEGLYTEGRLQKPSHAKLPVEYPISVKEQREGNVVLL